LIVDPKANYRPSAGLGVRTAKMRQFRFGQLVLASTIVISVWRLIAPPETAMAQGVTALSFSSSSHDRPKSVDPGPRGGPAGAGGSLAHIGASDEQLFMAARSRFQEINSVSGTLPGETGSGLGPRFNFNSCAGCHAFPAVGGSSPATNPQVAIASLDGADNVVPPFISTTGPVREARFVRKPDGMPDGGVHDLFVISGRADAAGCHIAQPDFAAALANNNVVFRIPTPLFGLGLVENVPDDNLAAAQNENRALAQSLGIRIGVFNRSGNDGTITRFGWKAQNKSLLIFAGEAYNVEQGVTNEAFPDKRETDPSCQYNGLPEDSMNLSPSFNSGSPASDYSSDIINFAAFARLSAPPVPMPATASTARGRQVFQNIGCHACHVTTQTTGQSEYSGQSKVTFSPFSDFALHDMGSGLADGVAQGNASGREFRTAPLWGIGQRLFFLHDGRTSDLYRAITAHASNGSEANLVVSYFEMLSPTDQQNLLNFLRSL
jgi:CxxC motif-containing protein (DUF1111 family)